MRKLLHNIRFYVLVFSVALSLAAFIWVMVTIPEGSLQIITLTRIYALTALTYLYFTLLAGPFCYTFRQVPYRGKYLKARRAIGVSVFYFGVLHASLAFFGQLGGFAGLQFLDIKYLVAIGLSFTALIILTLMTATSFDFMVAKLTFPKWKFLHRFVYLAGICILIHALLLGAHFSNLTSPIAQIAFFALVFLLLLEAPRFDKLLEKYISVPRFGLSFLLFSVLLGIAYFTVINPVTSSTNPVSFDIHAAHKQLAQQTSQQPQNRLMSTIPGLNGDRTKRYTVSLLPPDTVSPNQDTTLTFKIYDAANGDPVQLFRILYAKTMHMIIADSSLQYFAHIHPTQIGNAFTVTTQFPKPDVYRIYLEFQPFGGIEQQVGFTLPVGVDPSNNIPGVAKPVDTNQTKLFGDYEVTLDAHGQLDAQNMSLGNEKISFTIKNAKTKKSVTTLKPYLASFGHLTMIREQTYDFIHVHPYSTGTPPPNASGGPTVDFLPIGIYGQFKPGVYRVFAEFKPDGNLITADFTVKVN